MICICDIDLLGRRCWILKRFSPQHAQRTHFFANTAPIRWWTQFNSNRIFHRIVVFVVAVYVNCVMVVNVMGTRTGTVRKYIDTMLHWQKTVKYIVIFNSVLITLQFIVCVMHIETFQLMNLPMQQIESITVCLFLCSYFYLFIFFATLHYFAQNGTIRRHMIIPLDISLHYVMSVNGDKNRWCIRMLAYNNHIHTNITPFTLACTQQQPHCQCLIL